MTDSIAAYCVDKAVLTFGIIIENALAETVDMGKDKRSEPRYTLGQLLEPVFRLPKPLPELRKASQSSGVASLMAMVGQSGGGFKQWNYVKPS